MIITKSGHSGAIGEGLVILLGIEEADTVEDLRWLSKKIVNLRIFNDAEGVMNVSLLETRRECMIVSQFTLHASTKKGNRPSWIRAARPEKAIPFYDQFIREIERETGRNAVTGVFGDHMDIRLVNDGPVTIIIDSKSRE